MLLQAVARKWLCVLHFQEDFDEHSVCRSRHRCPWRRTIEPRCQCRQTD